MDHCKYLCKKNNHVLLLSYCSYGDKWLITKRYINLSVLFTYFVFKNAMHYGKHLHRYTNGSN